MRRSGAIAAALLALLLPAGTASGAAWSPPVVVSAPGEENTGADVALTPDGTTVVAWRRATCSGDSEKHKCENGRIQYSVRPLGGSFSPPQQIPGDPAAADRAEPRLAVDASGNVLAAWVSGGLGSRVRYSLRPPGGVFGAAQTVPDATAEFHNFPDVAMAPDGRAVVTFERSVAGVREAGYAIRPAGGDFGAAHSMTADPGVANVNRGPQVQLDAAGAGIAHWTSTSPGETAVRFARLGAGGGEFAPTETLAAGGLSSLAMAPSGAAVIAWSPSGPVNKVLYALQAPGGGFGPALSIPEPDSPLSPRVAIDPSGRMVAAWTSSVAPKSFPRWSASPAGGPFGAVSPLPPGGEGVLGDLEMSDRGTALALWIDTSEPTWEVQASLRPADGTFGDPTPLPGPPQGVELFRAKAALDPNDNAAAIWNGRDPLTGEPHDVPLLVSVLDADVPPAQVAPRISGLRVRPKRFSVGVAPTAKSSAARKGGTTVRFSLSESATVRLTVQRRRPGVRVRSKGKLRCLPATERNRARGTGKRCSLYKRAGAIVRRNRNAGPNRIKFSGRIGPKALKPGRYRFVAVAIDQGGSSSAPRRAGFQVLRP